MKADIPCNLCEGTEVTVLSYRGRGGNRLRTVACVNCGLVWSDPRPHNVRQFYQEQYRLAYKRVTVPKPRHVVRAGMVALSRLEKIRSLLHGRMRVLDVGSGGGEFAYLLALLGHDVQGVEPNVGYATYSTEQYGLNVAVGFIGDVLLPDARFDLITVWHVLEHTEDPGAVLRKLHSALRPDGVLVVEVPNVEATCQSPNNTFHDAHLYSFNPATLIKLAEKAGFTERSTQLSPDGGNITAVFRRLPVALASGISNWSLPNNHARIARVVSRHTLTSHWLSRHPYRRFAGRVARALSEWRLTRKQATGRDRLDALYSLPALEPSRVANHISPRPARRLWLAVAGAYALAVLIEWLLLDTAAPRQGDRQSGTSPIRGIASSDGLCRGAAHGHPPKDASVH